VRPNRLSAGIPAGPLARAATSASDARDADRKAQFRQHPRWRIFIEETKRPESAGEISKIPFRFPLHRVRVCAPPRERRKASINLDRSTKHFTAAAPKPPPLGENQVSVAPLAHCETRLEGTLSSRLSLAHADALVS
jgi:hypothetical protein